MKGLYIKGVSRKPRTIDIVMIGAREFGHSLSQNVMSQHCCVSWSQHKLKYHSHSINESIMDIP